MLRDLVVSACRKTMAVFVALTTILGTTVTPAFAGGPYGDQTATPIQHIVVIFQENVSFDHYFGTYPYAMNPAGEPPFHAAARHPDCQWADPGTC